MFVLLVGPKGSGKSHVGRVLERNLGVRFLHVEPLWMAYHAECKAAGRPTSIAEGVSVVHPRIREALQTSDHVCVETTGASPEILADLLSLAPPANTLVARVDAPLELCLKRIAARDQTNQIQMDAESITQVHALSVAALVEATFVIENTALSEAELVSIFRSALTFRQRSDRTQA
jgi:predicted kinase